jgi:hypothetical protein
MNFSLMFPVLSRPCPPAAAARRACSASRACRRRSNGKRRPAVSQLSAALLCYSVTAVPGKTTQTFGLRSCTLCKKLPSSFPTQQVQMMKVCGSCLPTVRRRNSETDLKGGGPSRRKMLHGRKCWTASAKVRIRLEIRNPETASTSEEDFECRTLCFVSQSKLCCQKIGFLSMVRLVMGRWIAQKIAVPLFK